MTPSSTLLAVYVVRTGHLAQPIGVAHRITFAKAYTELPDSSALTLHCSQVLPHTRIFRECFQLSGLRVCQICDGRMRTFGRLGAVQKWFGERSQEGRCSSRKPC